uniref:Uncharacterized protein n=1 Tax=Panagrolaimus sp. JU765 TaxID=591449 RepID=A0AC34QDZ7_9BILA
MPTTTPAWINKIKIVNPTTTASTTTSSTSTTSWTTTTTEINRPKVPLQLSPRLPRIDEPEKIPDEAIMKSGKSKKPVPKLSEQDNTTKMRQFKMPNESDEEKSLEKETDDLNLNQEVMNKQNSEIDDTINVKLQYLETNIHQQFTELWNYICHLHNSQIELMKQNIHQNPTMAVRSWLQRQDIT